VPLLRSDYQGPADPGDAARPVGNQGHTYGLSMWVPFYGTGEFYNDGYSFRSHICPALGTMWNPNKPPIDWKPLKKTLADWHAAAQEYYGDYYPLTKYSRSEDDWMAWQFNRPENGSGVVQAFRHASSPYESIRVKLQGLDKDAIYTLTNLDIAGSTEIRGGELFEKGLLIKTENPREAVIITYKKKS
jgi:alpha-galactosidase